MKSHLLFTQFPNKFKIKMPGGGLPGVGRFTMGGKHNESWFKLNRLSEKKQVFFYFFKILFNGIFSSGQKNARWRATGRGKIHYGG